MWINGGADEWRTSEARIDQKSKKKKEENVLRNAESKSPAPGATCAPARIPPRRTSSRSYGGAGFSRLGPFSPAPCAFDTATLSLSLSSSPTFPFLAKSAVSHEQTHNRFSLDFLPNSIVFSYTSSSTTFLLLQRRF